LYLEYSEYQSWGGALSEPLFNRAEFVAQLKIDAATHGHYKDVDPVPEVVKKLVFELIERVYGKSLSGGDYTSMTVGGMSLTYGSNKKEEEDDLIAMFLAGEDGVEIATEPGGISFAPAERV